MTRETSKTLEEFLSKFTKTAKYGQISFIYPITIRRSPALLRSFLESIKSSCFDNKSGYESISNYVISTLASRIIAFVEGYENALQNKCALGEDYGPAMILLLETIYFFYNVDPTVASSLRVAQAAILAFDFCKKFLPDVAPFLREQLVRWTFEFIKEVVGKEDHEAGGCVPLEVINVLLVLAEVGSGEVLARQAISEFCRDVESLGYFEIVSYLFCLKDDPHFDELRNRLFERGVAVARGSNKVRIDAEAAHLALDLLSCPFVAIEKRTRFMHSLRTDLNLAKLSNDRASVAVRSFENLPWFVNWRDPNLLAMIRKKELSSVY